MVLVVERSSMLGVDAWERSRGSELVCTVVSGKLVTSHVDDAASLWDVWSVAFSSSSSSVIEPSGPAWDDSWFVLSVVWVHVAKHGLVSRCRSSIEVAVEVSGGSVLARSGSTDHGGVDS